MGKKERRKVIIKSFLFLLLSFGLLSFSYEGKAASALEIEVISGGQFVRESDGRWMYEREDGSFVKDHIVNIDEKIYYFSEDGYRQYGWQKLDGKYYYFGKESEGYMYKKKWVIQDNTHRYYLKTNGVRAVGWLKTGTGKKYYFGKDGVRYYGWNTINGIKYYFGEPSDGNLYTSTWIILDGYKYYVKKDGSMKTGWLTRGANRYYLDEEGHAVTGNKKIDGKYYYFNKNGKLLYDRLNFNLYSDCAILVEADTGQILYGKNEKKAHANASTTKILTCILALEKGSLSDKIVASANVTKLPSAAVKLGMRKGDSFKKKDLLYALMLPSANDAAIALAEYTSGSTANFVKKMNTKARSIGCINTKFATVNGLDSGVTHYSTAYDVSRMMMYAMKNSTFRQIIATPSHSFKSQKGYFYKCYTKNELLGKMSGMLGGKTGYTKKAGNCFVGAVKSQNGRIYISVTLGAATEEKRWKDSKILLDYAYNL